MLSPEEERPRAKKRKEEDGWCLESRLTDDLILNCVARLSRSELAALSLASKSYRSLVASPDLYKIRSLIGRTETHVYVCLRTPPGPDPPTLGWYILRRSETKSDLIPIPSPPPSPPLPLEGSSVVVLDWGIYVIGGLIKEEERTGDVWLLDCRTHTWRPVPSMGVARAYGAAGVVDGKIYVIGGCDDNNNNWGQVFDPKTRKWVTLPPKPKRKIDHKNIRNSMVRDHKVYAADGTNRTYYYSPREGKWGTGNRGQQYGNPRDWCMIGNLICCLSRYGTIFWCDPDELDLRRSENEEEEMMMMMNTKEVKGLGSLKRSLFLSRVVHIGDQMLHLWEKSRIMNGHAPNNKSKCARMQDLEILLPGARLINSGGGNIMLFWDHYIHKDRLDIWCAEISLERRQGEGGHDEVWGKTEWSSVVMTFPFELLLKHHKVLHSVSVTL